MSSSVESIAISDAERERAAAGRLSRLAREPLVHFLALGFLLFVSYRVIQGPPPEDPKRIDISEDAVARISLAWQARAGRLPSREELSGLVEDQVKEEVLYREALALGLDKDDSIVRRRLAQKMGFLLEDVTAWRDPSAEELKAWFANNRGEFEEPARVSFRHLYFSPDRRGAQARDDAERMLVGLKAPREKRAAEPVPADPFMFQSEYSQRTPQEVAQVFGVAFAGELAKLPAGAWVGPVESGYGWHLVRVEEAVAPRVPEFETVEPAVREAWMREQRDLLQKAAYERARARYEVAVKSGPPAGGTDKEPGK
jgi:peptidyl-prolyl cis-trans isomerase C